MLLSLLLNENTPLMQGLVIILSFMVLSVGGLAYATTRTGVSRNSRIKLCVLTWLTTGFYYWILRGAVSEEPKFLLLPLLLLVGCLYATYITYRALKSGKNPPS